MVCPCIFLCACASWEAALHLCVLSPHQLLSGNPLKANLFKTYCSDVVHAL